MTSSTEEYVNLAQECLREGRHGPLKDIVQNAIRSLGDYRAESSGVQIRCRGAKWTITVTPASVRVHIEAYGAATGDTYVEAVKRMAGRIHKRDTEQREIRATVFRSLVCPINPD